MALGVIYQVTVSNVVTCLRLLERHLSYKHRRERMYSGRQAEQKQAWSVTTVTVVVNVNAVVWRNTTLYLECFQFEFLAVN